MSIQIGKYYISEWPDDIADFFIQHEDGEGMGVTTERLEELFEELWEEF